MSAANSFDPDEQSLADQYDTVLSRLFKKAFGEDEALAETRIIWSHALRLRKTGASCKSGLYMWGVETCPIYIGKAVAQTFEERFGRYVWQTKSQCKLATCDGVAEGGMAAFPVEVQEWNRKNKYTYNSRLRGAARFAREGIDKVWFAFFPMTDAKYMGVLEQLVIPIGNEWNRARGLPPLENGGGDK